MCERARDRGATGYIRLLRSSTTRTSTKKKKNDSGPYNKLLVSVPASHCTLRGFGLVGSLRDYNEQFREESTDTEKPHRRDEDEAMWFMQCEAMWQSQYKATVAHTSRPR